MPKSPIPAISKSITRDVVDFIEEVNNEGIVQGEILYHNFEARQDENDLPKTTLLGTDGFAFDDNDGRWIVRFAIGISSFKDANLLDEVDLLGRVHERFGKDEKIRLRDLQDGEEINELVVSAFNVAPMGQSELRNYRVVSLELHRTGAEY